MIGIVSGPLVDSGYIRSLIAVGSFLTVFGLMMTSLATEYYQVSHPLCPKSDVQTLIFF